MIHSNRLSQAFREAAKVKKPTGPAGEGAQAMREWYVPAEELADDAFERAIEFEPDELMKTAETMARLATDPRMIAAFEGEELCQYVLGGFIDWLTERARAQGEGPDHEA